MLIEKECKPRVIKNLGKELTMELKLNEKEAFYKVIHPVRGIEVFMTEYQYKMINQYMIEIQKLIKEKSTVEYNKSIDIFAYGIISILMIVDELNKIEDEYGNYEIIYPEGEETYTIKFVKEFPEYPD